LSVEVYPLAFDSEGREKVTQVANHALQGIKIDGGSGVILIDSCWELINVLIDYLGKLIGDLVLYCCKETFQIIFLQDGFSNYWFVVEFPEGISCDFDHTLHVAMRIGDLIGHACDFCLYDGIGLLLHIQALVDGELMMLIDNFIEITRVALLSFQFL
jgi:hypothetical protein